MHHDPLLLDLYACPAQPGHWPQVLDRLCDSTGAASAVVQAFRFERDGGRLLWQTTDHATARRPTPPMASTANPRLSGDRRLRGLDRVVTDDELFERDDPERLALEGQLAQVGIGRFMGMLQRLDGNTYVALALHRAVGDGRDFGTAESQRLQALAPHLRQAVQLAGLLQQSERARLRLEGQLDGLRCGLVLCDSQARVHWMNGSARALTEGALELLLHDGTLVARQAAAARHLKDEIAFADGQTRFVALGQGGQALHLALRSWQPQGEERSVLIALTRAGDAAGVPPQAWCRLLGVTQAEAALVATLAGGGTLESHAEQRGVAIGTVRGQLKQVLAKTGRHRQADLVQLAWSSAAAHLLDSVTLG